MVETATKAVWHTAGVFRRRVEPGSTTWYFSRDKLAVMSLVLIAVIVAAALFAPVLTPFAAEGRGAPDVLDAYLSPSLTHLFGTDDLGRDELARTLFGLRTSLLLGICVVSAGAVAGTVLGAVAGYKGGWLDEIIMRFTDIVLSFPPLLLAIVVSAVLSPSFWHAVLAIASTWWPWYVRLVRAQAVTVRSQRYVLAARSMGARDSFILARHVVPNVLGPVRVQATFDIGTAILTGAALSFLGLGTQPPTADLGVMVSQGRTYLLTGDWWMSVFPGLAIFTIALAFILIGDGLQTVTNPRLRQVSE